MRDARKRRPPRTDQPQRSRSNGFSPHSTVGGQRYAKTRFARTATTGLRRRGDCTTTPHEKAPAPSRNPCMICSDDQAAGAQSVKTAAEALNQESRRLSDQSDGFLDRSERRDCAKDAATFVTAI